MQFGYELEFFPIVGNSVVPLTNHRYISHDDCGFLLEAKSEPSGSVRKSIAYLNIAVDKLAANAKKAKLRMVRTPLMNVSDDVRREVRCWAGKDALSVQNLYNIKSDPYQEDHNVHGASLQVSFSDNVKLDLKRSKYPIEFNMFFDHVPIIRRLDFEFAQEIKDAQRAPGFYAIKPGRVEYRSLPNNISIPKLQRVLIDMFGDT